MGPFVESVQAAANSPPWWFNALVQVATAVLSVAGGALVVMWQLGRQHKATLEQQRHQMREQLKGEIFRDISNRLNKASDSLGTFIITSMTLIINLQLRRDFLDQSGRPYITGADYTPERIIGEHGEAVKGVIAVMHLLEDYEIAFTGFQGMKQRLAEKLQELADRFREFYEAALPYLTKSVDEETSRKYGVAAGTYTPEPPVREQLVRIDGLARGTQSVLHDLTAFIWDIRVAAQNYLLGGVFPGQRAAERQPQDPSMEVLRQVFHGRQ